MGDAAACRSVPHLVARSDVTAPGVVVRPAGAVQRGPADARAVISRALAKWAHNMHAGPWAARPPPADWGFHFRRFRRRVASDRPHAPTISTVGASSALPIAQGTPAPDARDAALAQLSEGVIVTGADGRITFVNEAATWLHGVARLDVAPDAYAETYQLFTEDGAPYPSTDLPLARAVLRGETVTDARWRIRRPDGTVVLAVGSARPVLGPDGKRLGAVLTVRDDGARAAAEAAEARAARILEQVSDAHITLDRAFRFVTVILGR